MLWIVEYAMPPERAHDLAAVFPRHRTLLDEFVADRSLLHVGPFEDRTGAMGVFRTRDAAEAFTARDPSLLEGLADPKPLRGWDAR